jgi:hypothetical protein
MRPAGRPRGIIWCHHTCDRAKAIGKTEWIGNPHSWCRNLWRCDTKSPCYARLHSSSGAEGCYWALNTPMHPCAQLG